MYNFKKFIYLVTIFFFAISFTGCSDDKEKKEPKTIEATQEKVAKDVSKEIKKPIEDANKAREQLEKKSKKSLEGC
jgi:hypothetical protein